MAGKFQSPGRGEDRYTTHSRTWLDLSLRGCCILFRRIDEPPRKRRKTKDAGDKTERAENLETDVHPFDDVNGDVDMNVPVSEGIGSDPLNYFFDTLDPNTFALPDMDFDPHNYRSSEVYIKLCKGS